MSLSITSSLAVWTSVHAVEAKDAVLAIEDSHGLEAILDAIQQRKLDLASQLAQRTPSDSGAEYADVIGQMKGLDQVPLIVAGIIEHGRNAELAMREQNES